MSKNNNKSAEELRRRAEKRLDQSKQTGASPAKQEELQRLVHELEVHQIELEMQNEELLQARSELEGYLGQFTDLYDFAPAGYFTLDHNGVILRVNLTGALMLGMERAWLLKQRFGRFVTADFRPAFTALLAKVFQRQSQETFEIALQKEGNGTLFVHVEVRVSEDGRECRVAMVDITAQKQAEESLRESERKYRTLFETMSQGVVHQRSDGNIISANPAAERILGLSIDQMQGRTSTDPRQRAIHEDGSDFPGDTHPAMLALRTGKAVQNVVMGLFSPQADGYRWININAVPQFLTGEDRPYQVFTIFEDITDRKHMEVILKKSEYEKGVILSSMSEKVIYYDSEMKICWANRSACDFFKKEPDEVVGKSCQELDHQTEDCQGCPVKVVIETGHYHQDVLERPDGKTMDISGYPVFESDGHLAGVVEVSRDITEYTRIQAELIKAKEESEAASTAKSRFLANISHEIRTPMNVIIGMANLVHGSALSQEQEEYIGMIRDSAVSLLTLINDILDFSKIEAHRLELAQVQFDLFREVERTILSFALQAQKKGLKLSYSIDANIQKNVLGDPVRLHQVLVNLVGNAIKFTDKGEIILSLRQDGKEVDEGEGQELGQKGTAVVRFSISDTGIGIPSDKVDWLFESFTQIDPSSSRKFEGTGLGLAISKSLVELMGGSIKVTSVENRGSTFYFTIPFALPGDTGETKESFFPEEYGDSLSTDQPLPSQVKALEILLVEDKPMNQRLATALLEKKGHKVITAMNGEEALEKLKSQRVDLILMDIQMPGMDGLEATARIRGWDEEAGRYIPIIAMTAYSIKEEREKCLQAGMDYYISKPINPEELYYALDKVVEGKVDELTQQINSLEDAQEMLNRLGGNLELLEELVGIYFQDYLQDMEKLKECMEKKDAPSLAAVVHGLKGELGNMGMKRAYKIACELEKMVKENTLEEASAALEKLENEIMRLERFFFRPGWQGRIDFRKGCY